MFDLIEIEFWLYKFFSFIISNPILLISLCFVFIFLMVSKWEFKLKTLKKNLFFSIIMFVLLLLFFELILSAGGYFYVYIYSNLDSSKIEGDAFRILFLGESTTIGSGVDREDTYPAQVEKILQQKYPDTKIKSYNRGVSGIETTAILRNLDKNIIKYKPHLTILMAGCNDYCLSGDGSDFAEDQFLKLDKGYFRSKLYRLIILIRDTPLLSSAVENEGGNFRYIQLEENKTYLKYPIPYYLSKPHLCTTSQVISNLNTIIQRVFSYGSKVWFVGYLQPDVRKRVNPALRKIAEENNITYVGDYPEVDFVVNRSLFAEDCWHPSKEGHRIIAEKIVERIISESIINRWQPD